MTKFVLIFSLIFSGFHASAKTSRDEQLQATADWRSFEEIVEQARAEDRTLGTSYLLSGALVALGGVAGAQSAGDDTSKLMFTLSQSLGIAGIGYGIAKLSFGNQYNSLYDALRDTSLTKEQRDQIVRIFMEREREKQQSMKHIKIITHILLGAVNLYAASKEENSNSKTFLQFFGGANFALAAAYTF